MLVTCLVSRRSLLLRMLPGVHAEAQVEFCRMRAAWAAASLALCFPEEVFFPWRIKMSVTKYV